MQHEFELRKLELNHAFEARKHDGNQALERQKLDRQHGFEARKEYARQGLEYVLAFQNHLKEYAQLALRSIFLMNGVALVGLLSFIGTSAGKNIGQLTVFPALFVPAFWKFALGLISTVLSMFFAYLNYMFHQSVEARPGDLANNMITPQPIWPINFSDSSERRINATHFLGVTFGLLGGLLFILGCHDVADVFLRLRGTSQP